jgi:hypothetical protein
VAFSDRIRPTPRSGASLARTTTSPRSIHRLGLALGLILTLLGCKETKAGPRIRLGPAALIARLPVQPSSAVRTPDGALVVGTRDGRLLLREPSGEQRWITPEATPTSNPATKRERAPTTRPTARYDGPVRALAISSDGRRLLAAGGRRIAWWQIRPKPALLAELVGPQTITAAVLTPAGKTALFGTSQGHLLEWTLDQREAKALTGLSCGALPASRQRQKLPPAKRCPYGTYIELPSGRGVCTYPLTHLVRQGDLIARACRTGVVAFFHHGKPAHHHTQAGALTALAFADDNRVVFARKDGELRLYDLKAKEVLATFNQKSPTVMDTSGELTAIASKRELRIWRSKGELAGAVKLPAEPAWLLFRQAEFQLLLADGRLLRWKLTRSVTA